jgi:hypothetical protein
MTDEERWAYFETQRRVVGAASKMIKLLTRAEAMDVHFLEHEFVPKLGLNNEMLHEQPEELSAFFGKGLHLWQYPNQLAKYLAWLTHNAAGIRTYAEIGCCWGGTFIVISEWLRRFSGSLERIIAIDPIGKTPLLDQYFTLLQSEGASVSPLFSKNLSTSEDVRDIFAIEKPDFVFVDGDHTLEGAFRDHLLARVHADIIVHHDVASQACPGTVFVWQAVRQMESVQFDATEFTRQYKSVKGSFLGIGILKRRSAAKHPPHD